MKLRRFATSFRMFGLGTFCRGRGANRLEGDYVSDASPVIVGGCGRSGTTLLRVMLDSHRNICCGPESELFLPIRIHLYLLTEWFEMPPRTALMLFRKARCRAEFADRFFREYCRLTSKPRWAEKTPRNVLNMDFIFRAFPRAKFIHLIRDGRDVACSLRTHPRHRLVKGRLVPCKTWKPIETCIRRWTHEVRAALAHRDDPRYMEVRYEDLVTHPKRTLQKVTAFVDEPWDENMLTYHEVRSGSRDPARYPQSTNAAKAIDGSSLERWRRDLSDEDKAVFKQTAGDLLVELGYETSNDW